MIPDEAVEAAARAAHARRAPNFPWSDIVPEVQAEMLADARHILEAAAPHLMASRELLEAAWDDGNCVGLDGWIGPARGEPVDDYALQVRERFIQKALDERKAPDARG